MTATPKLMPKVQSYLTIIPGRKPEQKLHTSLGQAKNAFGTPRTNTSITDRPYGGTTSHGWGELWHHTGGDNWALLYEIPQPQDKNLYTRQSGNGSSYVSREIETRPWRIPEILKKGYEPAFPEEVNNA